MLGPGKSSFHQSGDALFVNRLDARISSAKTRITSAAGKIRSYRFTRQTSKSAGESIGLVDTVDAIAVVSKSE